MSEAPDPRFKAAADTVTQDWDALALYLARRGATFGPARPRQFAGGFGNLNYLIELDGSPAVLRRPPSGPLPRGANDMAREHRILSALWQAYPLAPRSLLFCPDPAVLGAPFQVIEHRSGIIIRDRLPAGLADAQAVGAALSRQLVESLVALHALDPARVGLQTLGRPAGFLGRTVEGWAARAAALAAPIASRVFPEALAWLRRHVPTDRPATLIHCDFKLDNLIVDPVNLSPVAVIDWDMGTRGDPYWDLAVLLAYWDEPEDPACMHRLRQMPTARPGFWRRRDVLEAYQRLSGSAVDDFAFYRVLSVFRSAIVFLQLYDRHRRNPEADPACAGFGALGRELLDYSFEIASGRAE
jgi:aminoglycoside phosphotransferase (APT) family kinase protein